jgi:hypothetical protein
MARHALARRCSRRARAPLCAALLSASALAASPAGAIEIVFDYRFDASGFFDDPARRERLEQAAREYSDPLRDELATVRFDALRAVIPDPGGAGLVALENLEVPADSLVVFVGARPLGGRLAVGAPGQVRFPCFELFPRQRCFDAMRGRGDLREFEALIFAHLFRSSPGARAYPPEDFAPWGGFLSFATDASWYSGSDESVPDDRFDLLSVAIHELGHVLGIGTAESWAVHTSGRRFRGSEVARVFGAAAPLEPDQSHWIRGILARGQRVARAAAFEPGLARGERRRLTELDLAALRDLGWTPAPGGPGPSFDEAYAGRRIQGDVDGDGRVDGRDEAIVRAYVELGPVAAGVDGDEADVFPATSEGPLGDGSLDENDLRLLDAAVSIAEFARVSRRQPLLAHFQGALLRAGLPGDPDAASGLVRLLGAPAGPDPSSRMPLRGDLDRDGVLTPADVGVLEGKLATEALADERAFDAADVTPLVEGEARGDGVVDETDAALLAAAVRLEDLDGDGVPTEQENLLNQLVWMPLVGRPRYEPLTRWTESCLDPEELGPFGRSVAETGGPSLEFCGRDGTPWSLAPSASPEEFAEGDPPVRVVDARDAPRAFAGGTSPEGLVGGGGPPPPARPDLREPASGTDAPTAPEPRERLRGRRLSFESPPMREGSEAPAAPRRRGEPGAAAEPAERAAGGAAEERSSEGLPTAQLPVEPRPPSAAIPDGTSATLAPDGGRAGGTDPLAGFLDGLVEALTRLWSWFVRWVGSIGGWLS